MNITYDTPELRERLDAVAKECVALHIPPPPVTWVSLKVEDETGNIVHEHTEKANSWVRNFYNYMISLIFPAYPTAVAYGAGSLSHKDTGGTQRGGTTKFVVTADEPPKAVGLVGDPSYGIVVGVGTGAESFESHVLGTPCANGTAANQLAYAAGAIGAISYAAETKKWTQTITRVMNNNGASDVVVSEIGLYRNYSVSSYYNFMLDRSLLAEAVTVPAANKLTVTYTLEMTFPA